MGGRRVKGRYSTNYSYLNDFFRGGDGESGEWEHGIFRL